MKICMFGTGSLGSNTVINLARRFGDGVEFVLVDFDRIEEVNKANQPWYDVNVGQLKVSVLSAFIYRVNKVKSVVISSKIENTTAFITSNKNDLKNVDLYVDCFDNLPSRRITQSIADEMKTLILHSGFTDNICLCAWGSKFPLNGKGSSIPPVCNRRELGSLVSLGAGATALVITNYFVEKRKDQAFLELDKGKARLTIG